MTTSTNLFFVPSEDPTALGRRLADAAKRAPMVHDAGMNLPVLLRKSHINAVFRDAETFSTRMYQAGILKGGLASLQGEEHTKTRRIYNMFFLPRAVERYEDTIVRPTVREVLSKLERTERADLLDAFAVEMPRRVISTLFGFPLDQLEVIDQRARAMFRSIVRVGDPVAAAEGQRAYEETLGQITDIVRREEAHPSGTLLGEILRTLEANDMATMEACQQIVLSLLLGGYETTIWMLANALHALLAHPEAMARVRVDNTLLPAAIDESMRWCPSVTGTLRLVERDVEVDGLALAAGTAIYVSVAPQYDEESYPLPEVFDISRRPAPAVLLFGGGPHYCVGAPLARMEARVGLSMLLERFPHLRANPSEKATFVCGVRESIAHGPDRIPALLK